MGATAYRQPAAPDFIGLMSLDFGSVFTMDGREHPVTATTPVQVLDPSATPAITNPASAAPVSQAGMSVPSWLIPSMPAHGWARLVVGIIAIALIIVVALRITL